MADTCILILTILRWVSKPIKASHRIKKIKENKTILACNDPKLSFKGDKLFLDIKPRSG